MSDLHPQQFETDCVVVPVSDRALVMQARDEKGWELVAVHTMETYAGFGQDLVHLYYKRPFRVVSEEVWKPLKDVEIVSDLVVPAQPVGDAEVEKIKDDFSIATKILELESLVGEIKVVRCTHCDFSSGMHGGDRCVKCDGVGSGFRVRHSFFPNTELGYLQALECKLETRGLRK